MIGKDMLSQEEIDALLRQDTSDTQPSIPVVNDYLNALETDVLGEIGNICFGSASTALSSLLRQKVDITTPTVNVILRQDLPNEFPNPHVAVHVEYTDGFKGINLLVLKLEDARIIADLMLGNDGTNPSDMGDMEISACQEAMNQMMGSAATSMSTVFNKMVNISPPGIDILDLPNEADKLHIADEDVLVQISFRLIIGNLIDSKIMQLIPVSFAREMASNLLGDSEPMLETQPTQAIHSAPVEKGSSIAEMDQALQNLQSQPVVQENTHTAHLGQVPQQSPVPTPPQYIGGNSGMMRTPNVAPIQFSSFDKENTISTQNEQNLNLLLDIPLQVTVELGRTKRLIKDILELGPGSIVELDKLAGEPVDILVNNKLVAKGEVVVIEENFGVRVTEIVSQWERLMKLQ